MDSGNDGRMRGRRQQKQLYNHTHANDRRISTPKIQEYYASFCAVSVVLLICHPIAHLLRLSLET
jgi:hypothetical protein